MRHDDGRCTWVCERCGHEVIRWPGQSDTDCFNCGACYNAGGQRLVDNWRDNESNWNSEHHGHDHTRT